MNTTIVNVFLEEIWKIEAFILLKKLRNKITSQVTKHLIAPTLRR